MTNRMNGTVSTDTKVSDGICISFTIPVADAQAFLPDGEVPFATTVNVMPESDEPAHRRLELRRPDPEDRNASASDRLLHAVICLLVERGAPLLADALKPEDVTKRAGKSRASYYRTEGFPASEVNNPESRQNVLERVIAEVLTRSSDDLENVVGGIGEYIANGWVSESPREFIRTTAEENFEEMGDYQMLLQLLAGSLAPSSPAIERSLGKYYSTVTEAYTKSYNEVFRFWGYRPRPPLTTEKFTIAVMALAEGLMLRVNGDPAIDQKLFGELIEIVGTGLLLADGDVAAEPVPPDHHLPGEVPPPSRGAIIATLVRLFENDRITVPTVEELASAVGCTEQTIRSQFGGVVGVIRAAWEEWIPEFEEDVERNRRMLRQPDPLTLLYRVCVAVARRAAAQQPLTRALLMSEVGVDPASSSERPEPISGIFERLLVEAGQRGRFRAPAVHRDVVGADPTFLFARSMRTTILTVVVSHPVPAGFSSEEHAQWCVDYVWSMLMPARGSGESSAVSSQQ